MNSLRIYHWFIREIKVNGWRKMPAEIVALIEKIKRGETVTGTVIRPVPQLSILMTIVMGGFGLAVIYVFAFLFVSPSFWAWPWDRTTALTFVLILLFAYYLFHFSFLNYWFFPYWVKKHPADYFMYVGPEGIIKKNYFFTAYVPLNIVDGALLKHGLASGGRPQPVLKFQLFVKGRKVFSPYLYQARGIGLIFPELITYRVDDLRLLETAVNGYVKK